MVKYKWDDKVIDKRLKALMLKYGQAKTEEEDTAILCEIDALENILDFINPQELLFPAKNKDKKSTLLKVIDEKYNYYKFFYHKIYFLKKDIKKFLKLARENKYDFADLPIIKFSNSDLVTFVHDFYQDLSPYFYKKFMKEFKNHNTNLYFDEDYYGGHVHYLPYSKEDFIIVGKTHTIFDYMTIAHEYGHATSAKINPHYRYQGDGLFKEFDTIFIEMLANDYYRKITKDDTNFLLYRAMRHNDYILSSKSVCDVFKLIKLKESLVDNHKLKKFYRHSNLPELEFDEELYALGYILAIELYHLYQKDKEQALNVLKNIISYKPKTSQEYYDKIKSYGLIPNKHLEIYQTNLERQLVKSKVQKL